MQWEAVAALQWRWVVKFLHEKFAQLAVTFLVLGLILSFFGFGGHAAAARAFHLFYIPFHCLKSGNSVLTLLFFVRFILIKIMYTGGSIKLWHGHCWCQGLASFNTQII